MLLTIMLVYLLLKTTWATYFIVAAIREAKLTNHQWYGGQILLSGIAIGLIPELLIGIYLLDKLSMWNYKRKLSL